ncbi:hypothetical protein [Bacillus sp. USDA818B3_A]|uniref:hypothetical protein n=1 Tax=Bacillus sp. USDA818B3_A TaxID=2698834 RepID=UPI00136C47F3|nr:hypothetical protein [Bacillus sp. USDA818B3_A]
MDKKQKISWGVSFGSLALVAGMVSYLGFSNNGNTNQVAINGGQQSSNNTNQQPSQGGFNSQQDQHSGQDFSGSWGGDSTSQFDQNQQSPDTNTDDSGQGFDNSNQQQGPYFNGGGQPSGHQHGYDTTTGGT